MISLAIEIVARYWLKTKPSILDNTPPTISLPDDPNVVDGNLRVRVGVETRITINASDPDNEMEELTFSFTNTTGIVIPEGASINNGICCIIFVISYLNLIKDLNFSFVD